MASLTLYSGVLAQTRTEDGARRAAEPALLAVLQALDLVSAADVDALASYARPRVLNTRGETVGEIVARVSLSRISHAAS